MSQGREVAHLGVINNSQRDHRDYTEKTRTVEKRNHRAQLEEERNNKMQLLHRQVDRSRIKIRARMGR